MKTALPSFPPLSAGIRIAIFAFGLILPLSAFAELTNDSLLGPGVRSRPAYDGSASRHVELVPVVRYFGQPWFVRSTQGVMEGGARFGITPGLNAGAQLAYESGRAPGESDFLKRHNVAGVNPGASVGVHLEWDHKLFDRAPFTVLARVRQHADSDRGAQADLRLSLGVFHKGPVSLGLFTQGTWANAKSTGALYGITPQQSATTGLPAHGTESGLLFASFGLLYGIDLAKHWMIVGSLEARRLHGDAASSPLAERASNHYLSAGLAYHF